MKPLSVALVLFGVLALLQPARNWTSQGRCSALSSFSAQPRPSARRRYRAFSRFLSASFRPRQSCLVLPCWLAAPGFGRLIMLDYLPPESLPLTVAIFSILVYAVAQFPMVRQIMRIADRYFNTDEAGRARIWPFRPFAALERRIGVAMVVFLVLINQAQVGIIVRLNFFNRDLFNAIQNHDAVTFWHQLLLVFTPFAFVYVAMAVVEFFTQSMLVIRWRRWLTDHFVSRWLARHNHYRISLVAGQTDNPDQRIAEDVYRFINGGSDGSNTAYGIYDFSILLISTLSSLVSFAIVLWGLSRSFTLPGTNIVLPGFLFWVALLYAGLGTLITHLIGRPLISLYFQRQHMEADFRFSLARLREYTEQVALLNGESAEQNMLGAALWGADRQLSRARLSTYARHGIYAHLWPDLPDHSLYLHSAVLFRPQNRARCDDANRRRVRARRQRADLLRQLLYLPCRIQIGGRPSELFRCGDRPGGGAQRCRAGARRAPAGAPGSTLRMSIFPCPTAGAWSRRNIWRWRRAKTLPFQALQAPANQRCFVRSRASGHLARAAFTFLRASA